MSGVFIRLDKVRPGLTGIMGCITDISYEEEKLCEAERRRKEAEERRKQQELLVDLTSHEIRTPVSAILQCSGLVKENLSTLVESLRFSRDTGFYPPPHLFDELESDLEALDSIYQCGLAQERIAGDILSFARVQLNMLSVHTADFDLRNQLQKVVSIFAAEARSKQINIRLSLGQSLSKLQVSRIKSDPVRLGQVITNLVANAICFIASSEVRDIVVHVEASWDPPEKGSYAMPEGKTELKVPVPADTPLYLYARVVDTGPGMDEAEMATLFQRFSQGNLMNHTSYGGSGLGLYVSKTITELLGGGITVQSELGKGSTFLFYIKAVTGAVTRLVQTRRTSSSGSDDSAHSPPLTTPSLTLSEAGQPELGLRVLVVEDNVITQTVLRRQLVKAGLTCEVANNGQVAIDMIHEAEQRALQGDRSGVFDAVLMDVEMPILDGLTATRRLRKMEASGSLPHQLVIALTGNARDGQIEEARATGMDDVVTKPYRFPDLLVRISKAVALRREANAKDGTISEEDSLDDTRSAELLVNV